MFPSHAGGDEITGPVGVSAFPQLSLTRGGVGTTIALTHAAVADFGAIGGNGLYSIVTVCT
jgi:hypothetical protein